MLEEVILHIGCEKTGTSSLQKFLTENAHRLRRQGFHYPAGRFRSYFWKHAHFPVAAAHASGPAEYIPPGKIRSLGKVKGHLKRDLARLDGRAILSCEHFSSRMLQSDEIVNLAKTLQGHTIRVVCYVREQASLLQAAYSTEIRTGRRTRFDWTEADLRNPYYNHLKMIDHWEMAFGRDQVRVFPYTREGLVGGDICQDFCAVLGLEFDDLQKVDERNHSLDALQCEALRQLNTLLPVYSVSDEKWRNAQRLRRAVIKVLPKGTAGKAVLRPEVRAQVQNRFREVNEELAARYFPSGLPSDWLAVPSSLRSQDASEATIALSDALSIVAEAGPRDLRGSANRALIELGFGQ